MSKENTGPQITIRHGFDMNQCKEGDKLVSVHGMIFVYARKNGDGCIYPHQVIYPDGTYGSRMNDGFVFASPEKRMECDHDIVGFAK